MKISSAHIQSFLRATILLGFAVYILYLLISGDILQFLVPNLVFYVKIADFFLFIVTFFQYYIAFVSLKKKVIICDCGHDHEHVHGIFKKSKGKTTFVYSLFFLPLLLAFLPDQSLSSSIADNRGMNLGGLASQGPAIELEGNEDPVLKRLFKTDVYNHDYAMLGIKLYKQPQIEMKDEWFIEKLQAMNTFVDNFQNKEIKIKGYIYREPGLAGNQFIIARMGMTHCIADISPFGIIAESVDASQFANDSWVTLTGKIGKTDFKGQTVIKIEVTGTEPAVAPKVPYVYPDWDFGKKL